MIGWRVATAAALVLVLAVYGAVLAAMPPGGFYSPDEGAKFLQMRSTAWDGGLRYAVPYGGAGGDPEYAYYPTRCRHEDLYPVRLPDGGVKLHWPIWFSLLTQIPVRLFGLRGLYLVPLLSGWLIALLSARLVGAYDRRLAPLAVLAVGLATPIAFFSLTHWEHTLAALLGLAGLALVAEPGASRRQWLAVPLLIAAVVLRLEMAPFALAVAIAWWARRALVGEAAGARRHLWLAAFALAAAVAVAALVGLLPARHLWLLQNLPTYAVNTLLKLPYLPSALLATLIDAPGNQAPVLPALVRVVALVAFVGLLVAPLLPRARTRTALGLLAAFLALDCCVLLAVLPQPYISLHGFFLVSPFCALAAWALPDAWRNRQPARVALASAAAAYLLLGVGLLFVFSVESDGTYRTGLEWGNRYMLTLYPLATVLALGGWQIWRNAAAGAARALVTVMAIALLLCGAAMQTRGLWVLYESRVLATAWQRALPAAQPVVTDVWWLAAIVAPYFEAHPLYCVRDAADLATWIESARARGVGEFAFASFKPITLAGAAPSQAELVHGLHIRRFHLQ